MNKEEEFLKGLQSGDRKMVKAIYLQFLPGITSFILKNNGSEEDARDIFQEALLVLHGKAQDPNFKLTSSFYTFLFAICKKIWLKRLEKKRKSRVTFLGKEELLIVEELEPHLEREAQYRLFRQKFRDLSQNCQKILQLFFQGTAMKEIAEIMGLGSVQYVKKRKFQCKERLVALVQADSRYNELL